MTHSEKLKKLYEHAPSLGISPYTLAPPIYRLFWRLGLEVAPPLFSAFLTNVLLMGGFFASAWGLCMWLFAWSFLGNISPVIVLPFALIAGGLFGVIMALYSRYKAKQLKLPPWSQYTGQAS
jgi:Family of unknown function (DUF6404)